MPRAGNLTEGKSCVCLNFPPAHGCRKYIENIISNRAREWEGEGERLGSLVLLLLVDPETLAVTVRQIMSVIFFSWQLPFFVGQVQLCACHQPTMIIFIHH
jgi:hypothetical protein